MEDTGISAGPAWLIPGTYELYGNACAPKRFSAQALNLAWYRAGTDDGHGYVIFPTIREGGGSWLSISANLYPPKVAGSAEGLPPFNSKRFF